MLQGRRHISTLVDIYIPETHHISSPHFEQYVNNRSLISLFISLAQHRPSSLDGGLRSLRRGELGGSELVTLLNAGGHSVTDGGGEVGSKRSALDVPRQDWDGPLSLLSITFEYCVLSFVVGKSKISNLKFHGISYPQSSVTSRKAISASQCIYLEPCSHA